jgi:CRP-like cAMP-binding protein
MTEKIIKDKITQDNDEAVDHCLYYIVKGSVVIHPNIIKDSEIIVLKELKEGECFGEYSFFTGISE